MAKFKDSNLSHLYREEHPGEKARAASKCALCSEEHGTITYKGRMICEECLTVLKDNY